MQPVAEPEPFLAYDLVIGIEAPVIQPGRAAALLAGWAGPEGPAIAAAHWPRAPRTGQPMRHCLTLWLPEPYRRRGDDLVAVSVFQWVDDYADRGPSPERPPVIPHPQSVVTIHPHTADIYGLVFLNAAELTGQRTTRPPLLPRSQGEDYAEEDARPAALGPIWLVPRIDPNAGRAPFGEDYDNKLPRFEQFGVEHLGGTLMNANDDGAGKLSAYYLELSGAGGFIFSDYDDLSFDLDAADPIGWTRR